MRRLTTVERVYSMGYHVRILAMIASVLTIIFAAASGSGHASYQAEEKAAVIGGCMLFSTVGIWLIAGLLIGISHLVERYKKE